MRYMLDTNICIYIIKHKPESVYTKLKKIQPEDVCISSITYSELAYGVEKSEQTDRNRLALTLMLSNIDIEAFDAVAAEEYGDIRARLEKAGTRYADSCTCQSSWLHARHDQREGMLES